jgi:CheY-like chemotaxis protein
LRVGFSNAGGEAGIVQTRKHNIGISVLVVDDEILIAKLVGSALQESGFEVTTIFSGTEAFRALNDAHLPSVLVTDVNVGDGPTGWDIARHARIHSPNMAIVYMTATSTGEWRAQSVPRSILVTKPFVSTQMQTAIFDALHHCLDAGGRTFMT